MQTIDNTYHEYLTKAFECFNSQIFNNQLSECVITMSSVDKAFGYFRCNIFPGVNELAITPKGMKRGAYDALGTVIHEMVHVWQNQHGKPGKPGYHNKQWASKMLEIGLTPISIDQPGKMTGNKVTHEITEGGISQKFINLFIEKEGGFLGEEKVEPIVFDKLPKIKRQRKYLSCSCYRIPIPFKVELEPVTCTICGQDMELSLALNIDG